MSDAQRHLMTLFSSALDHEAGPTRDAYLDQACAGDPELRARVEALLRSHEQAGRFLEPTVPARRPPDPPGAPAAGGTGHWEASVAAGSVVAGRYKLLEEIGEGGMGSVWMAEQTEPVQRRVAVKLIKPGMDSRAVVARFEAERQALALMDHPNIARVLDGGAAEDGRPFFVMELVKGTPITRHCDEKRLPVRERLALFADVCRAVQHAHQKGIIHRDIKPSNVLVAPYDGRAVVKVIDFGVAKATGQKLTEATLFTGFGAVVGTPEYMSPEQAQVNNQDIDTRSDVYSLGVLLYELLTGTTPLTRERVREAALLEVLRLVREEEPPRPSTRLSGTDERAGIAAVRGVEPARLSRLLRGELDWIVMKSLEKDRTRRYETANGFAADVERYLADEPVQACPPSTSYRLRKFTRRNRLALGIATGIVLGLVAGLIGLAVSNSLIDAERIEKEGALQAALNEKTEKENALWDALNKKAEADDQRARAQRSAALAFERLETQTRGLFALQLTYAATLIESDPGRGLRLLDDPEKCPPALRDFTWRCLRRLCDRRPHFSRVLPAQAVTAAALAGDYTAAAFAPGDGTASVFDPATGRDVRTLKDVGGIPRAITVSSGGSRLAVALDDRTVRVWATDPPKELASFPTENRATAVALSPDGRTVAVGDGKLIRLLDVSGEKPARALEGHRGAVGRLTFSRDGRSLLSSVEGDSRVWDVTSGASRGKFSPAAPGAIALSPDGHLVAVGVHRGKPTIILWDLDADKELAVLGQHTTEPGALAFSPDGTTLVSVDWVNYLVSSQVKLWSVRTLGALGAFEIPLSSADWVGFSPDGRRIAIAGGKATPDSKRSLPVLEGWEVAPTPDAVALRIDRSALSAAAVSPDGRVLAAAGLLDLTTWDLPSGTKSREFRGHKNRVWSVAIGTENRLYSGSADGTVRVWNLTTGEELASLKHDGTVLHVVVAPDGKQWASGTITGTIRVWDAEKNDLVWECRNPPGKLRVTSLAYSSDGLTLASGTNVGEVLFFNARDGTPKGSLKGHRGEVRGLGYSPGGKTLATGGQDKLVKLWDAATLKDRLTLKGHGAGIGSIALTQDGGTLATAGLDGVVKLHDPVTGVERGSFHRSPNGVVSVHFTRDDALMITAGVDGVARLWPAPHPVEKK